VEERITGSADSAQFGWKCAAASSVATVGAAEAGGRASGCNPNSDVFEGEPSWALELDMSALLVEDQG